MTPNIGRCKVKIIGHDMQVGRSTYSNNDLYLYQNTSHLGLRGTTPKKARNKAPTEPQQNSAARNIKPPEKAK